MERGFSTQGENSCVFERGWKPKIEGANSGWFGFEGMGRAEIIGSEMRRLAGEVYDFSFKHQKYGYKLSTAKLYHINGTIREKYVPTNYVKQSTNEKDEVLEKGIELINKMTK